MIVVVDERPNARLSPSFNGVTLLSPANYKYELLDSVQAAVTGMSDGRFRGVVVSKVVDPSELRRAAATQHIPIIDVELPLVELGDSLELQMTTAKIKLNPQQSEDWRKYREARARFDKIVDEAIPLPQPGEHTQH